MNQTLKATILVIEDDLGVAELQELRLRRLGHKILRAANGPEALAIAQCEQIDIAIIDYNLNSEMNGIAVFRALQTEEHRIPAILVTGFEHPDIMLEAMRAGIRDFLPKNSRYLDELPIAVTRVMRQVIVERQAAESEVIREKQELLEAAFDAAHLASWVWSPRTDSWQWTGHKEHLFGQERARACSNLSDFLQMIHAADRDGFLETLKSAEHEQEDSTFSYEFRCLGEKDEWRWFQAQLRCPSDAADTRMICVLNDITEKKEAETALLQSHSRIQALNDRLQLGMVESHHRVKNSLQNVISLLNLHSRKNGELTKEEVQKLSAHIHGLAVLHDLLVSQVKEEGSADEVPIDRVLERVIELLARAAGRRRCHSELAECRASPKQAASLAVILNELMSNALKHGKGDIFVSLASLVDRHIRLEVRSELAAFPENFSPKGTSRTGLSLVCLLAESDLGCQPEFLNLADGSSLVSLSFLPRSALEKGGS
jgi:PAS domain S-box-containing protein